MATTQRNTLLALVLVLGTGMALGAWWLLRTPPTVGGAGVESGSHAPPVVPVAPQAAPPTELAGRETESEIEAPSDSPGLATTVVFPLEVDLELVKSSLAPQVEGVHALGSDATARIRGSVHGANGEGVRAEVRFEAGANTGRVLYGQANGAFGANDLQPGLSIVRVSGPTIVGSLREVRLRKDRDTELNIGYGRLTTVNGEVQDDKGQPIAQAKVTIDGQEAQTDDQGVFYLPRVASGDTIVFVQKAGFAAVRENLTVPAGQTIEKGRLKYVLRTAARLQISIEEHVDSRDRAQVFVFPESLTSQRLFPWHTVNPVLVWPGGTTTVEDLPPVHVTLRVFHPGAVGKPASRSMELRAGETVEAVLHLEAVPALVGVVKQDGRPVENAEVALEPPERAKAMLSVLGESNYLFLENEVLPDLPPARQVVHTNATGEFQLSSAEQVSKERYLFARSPDGKSTAWKLLRGGETRVDLDLEVQAGGQAELVVQMEGRVQPLPVRVRVDGSPRDPQILPPGQDLHVDGLVPGSWTLNVRWHGEGLVRNLQVELKKEAAIPVALPDGAIHGQDADTVLRATKPK